MIYLIVIVILFVIIFIILNKKKAQKKTQKIEPKESNNEKMDFRLQNLDIDFYSSIDSKIEKQFFSHISLRHSISANFKNKPKYLLIHTLIYHYPLGNSSAEGYLFSISADECNKMNPEMSAQYMVGTLHFEIDKYNNVNIHTTVHRK
ncbi:MAG: hypothetical protein K9M99_03310 [Candidatus Cloacimonetes bacterium]|nr:hypothetical protein [Candidatus Cloacimonadota bacterium]